MKLIKSIIILILLINYAIAGDCTGLTRTNYVSNSILESSVLNADFNQIIDNANNYDLGCGTDGTLEYSALNTTDFSVVLSSISRGCEVTYSSSSVLVIAPCRGSVYQNFITTTATTEVNWTHLDAGSPASGQYYVYIDSESTGSTLTPVISATPPGDDGYNGNDKVVAGFNNVTLTASTINPSSLTNWENDKLKPITEIYWANITINSSASVTSETTKNYEWIGPKCSRSATGKGSCNFYNDFFSSVPHCWTTAADSWLATVDTTAVTGITFTLYDTPTLSETDGTFDLYCMGRRK